MGLGWGGGMQLSSCLHRASTGWKGDKAYLESCLSMEVGWSLMDGSAVRLLMSPSSQCGQQP